jgi:hypothetical protein
LAFAAMQKSWQEKDEFKPISQLTHPDDVINFIESEPGLKETCLRHLSSLAAYAPQLTLPGFGGPFEELFEAAYQCSIKKHQKDQKKYLNSKNLLTINHLPSSCDDLWALRHPDFGNYNASHIASHYVNGELMVENTKVFEIFDYLIWFLSDASNWFPDKKRRYLIEGFKGWTSWCWDSYKLDSVEFDISTFNSAGVLFEKMYDAANPKCNKPFKLSKKCLNDLQGRVTISCEVLEISDRVQFLVDRFLAEKFIETWVQLERSKRKRHKY